MGIGSRNMIEKPHGLVDELNPMFVSRSQMFAQ